MYLQFVIILYYKDCKKLKILFIIDLYNFLHIKLEVLPNIVLKVF